MAIEEETDTKILFLIAEKLEGLHTRCRITGRSTAIASAKNRIYWAEAAPRRLDRAVANTNPACQQYAPPAVPKSTSTEQTRLQSHPQPQVSASLCVPAMRGFSNTITYPLPTRPPPPRTSVLQASGKSDEFLKTVEETAKSPVTQESDASAESPPLEPKSSAQELQRVMQPAESRPSIHSFPPEVAREPDVAPHSSAQLPANDQHESTKKFSKATPGIPENAVFIKIEDDSDSDSDSDCSTTSTAAYPLLKKGWLNENVEAMLNKRESEVKKAKRECHILRYVLDYLGVPEEQVDLIHETCNNTRGNGKWDKSCHIILGRTRVKKK